MGAAGQEQARTQPDERERLAWHATLGDALCGQADSSAALEAVCEATRRLVGCDRVQVWRGDIRQMTMRTQVAVGYDAADAERLAGLAIAMREMPLAPDFLQAKYFRTDDPPRAHDQGADIFAGFGIASADFLLLERAGHVLGALQLSWCARHRAHRPARSLLDVAAAFVGLAVDMHARTSEALQTASALSDAATLISRIHDPDELLEAMTRTIVEAIGCDWGIVHLLDEPSGSFHYAAGVGPAEVLATFERLPPSVRVVDRALAKSDDDLIEITDVTDVPNIHRAGPALSGSWITVPLRRGQRVVGILSVGYTRRTGRFARRQIALVRGVAHHALAALENARLVRSLQQVNEVQADFVAAVSHDLRTPLHILVGYADMLLESAAGPLQPGQAELVSRVRSCAIRFLDLVNGILEVARLDAGRGSVRIAEVVPSDLCAAVVCEVDPGRAPEVALHWTASAMPVYGDAPKLTMLLRNLLTNALKFTRRGRVDVLAAVDPFGTIVLRVTDTGPGIGASERAEMFEMFRQGDAGRRAGGGLGLGLYLVKRIAEVLGGSAALVSGDPGHTVFEVRVPAARPRNPDA